MALKITLLVLAAIGLLGLTAKLSQKPQIPYDEWKNRNSLAAIAKRTKVAGQTEIVVPGPMVEYPGENMTLDDAFGKLSVVVVEPLESKSYIGDSDHIISWYRCRLDEVLSIRPPLICDTCPRSPEPPPDLPPNKQGEILIPRIGGSAIIDGVRVTMIDSIPEFELHKQYLLFVSIMPSGVAALTGGGYQHL